MNVTSAITSDYYIKEMEIRKIVIGNHKVNVEKTCPLG